ncbi:hypothetical protein [Ferrovum sp.]|uniref:hypothetical protein n=1 Tax=Ferrovum sp. TaxID=2609467 RepID=UPI002604CD2D|nr:hypothetical protein [Ferrovum sp.]
MQLVPKTSNDGSATVCTPLADALIKLRKRTSVSFHALPVASGASISGCKFQEKYHELFGEEFIDSEMTITGKQFDSFFFPETVIKEAEQLAATIYGADGTLFGTTGTSVSNQIAVHALHQPRGRVLLDKGCHQSLHFALHALGARVDYLCPSQACDDSGKSYWDLENLLNTVLSAQHDGDPYHLIVMNAHSYDGVIYDIPGIIGYLLSHGIETRKFLVDEAWGAANYFHEELKRYTAMNITPLLQCFPDLNMVATQSAHKSLSCLRQASMIHFRGSNDLPERLRVARFRIHTTSPSYPILASLDLGRAQIQSVGQQLMQQATMLAKKFCETINSDPALSNYRINSFSLPERPFSYVNSDPTKISLNIAWLGVAASEVREILYSRYGIYINRMTGNSILLNFHIGIAQRAVDLLLDGLREIQRDLTPSWQIQTQAESFIIPYPPGVPLVVPGDPVTDLVYKKICDIQRAGVRVFTA